MAKKVKVEGIEVPQWYLDKEPQLLEAIDAFSVAEDRLRKIRSFIYDMMTSEEIDTINSGLTEASLYKPTTVETIDKESLKRDFPDIFKEYSKASQRKGYVSVKLA